MIVAGKFFEHSFRLFGFPFLADFLPVSSAGRFTDGFIRGLFRTSVIDSFSVDNLETFSATASELFVFNSGVFKELWLDSFLLSGTASGTFLDKSFCGTSAGFSIGNFAFSLTRFGPDFFENGTSFEGSTFYQ